MISLYISTRACVRYFCTRDNYTAINKRAILSNITLTTRGYLGVTLSVLLLLVLLYRYTVIVYHISVHACVSCYVPSIYRGVNEIKYFYILTFLPGANDRTFDVYTHSHTSLCWRDVFQPPSNSIKSHFFIYMYNKNNKLKRNFMFSSLFNVNPVCQKQTKQKKSIRTQAVTNTALKTNS